jgi:CRP/FNR family cyclic AMP-dependent transcriptional regulator
MGEDASKDASTWDLHLALSRTTLLGFLDQDEAQDLASRGRMRPYARGTYLFHQGDEATHLFFITSGRVQTISASATGHERLHTILGSRQFVGELEVLGRGRRSVTARVEEDSMVWTVAGNLFLEFLMGRPRRAVALLGSLARLLQAQNDLIEDLMSLDLRGRLAKWLLALAGRSSGPPLPRRSASIAGMPSDREMMTSPATQEDLAKLCGASRENVARVLSDWQRRGVIVRQGRRYMLKDPQHLRHLAGLAKSELSRQR